MSQTQAFGGITLADVEAAQERVRGRVHRTPLLSSRTLGERIGAGGPVWLKAENLQKTGSFKPRGALNQIEQLSAEEKARGVITVSAGNHAQGVAWAAAAAGVKAVVVMAEAASPVKVAATRGYGAEVVLHGANNTEAFAEMERLARERGLTLIHPFDAPTVIAGHGTVGLEVLADLPEFGQGAGAGRDTVVVGIGGGGLISGIAVAIKAQRPSARIIGVEPRGAAAMTESLRAGKVVPLTSSQTIADGLAAPFAGQRTLAIVQQLVDDVVLLDDDAIVEGLRFLLERAKLVAEPAGAAATAALLTGAVPIAPGATVVAIVSGGNVDHERLRGYV
ncbi:MAG: threonine ammonia-lyase [Thermomicrobiales bacterium]